MFNRSCFSVITATLLCFMPILMGVNSCSEQKEYKEYCKTAYETKVDQAECDTYCGAYKDYSGNAELIAVCQGGQFKFLSGTKDSAAETVLECDRLFKDRYDSAKACRAGATAEELRTSKVRKGHGSATDRETGNNR